MTAKTNIEITTANYRAVNKRNQKLVAKTCKALAKYYEFNSLRDLADNAGDEKLVRKYDTACEKAFSKYLDLLADLPKYEQKVIDKFIA
jgi:hypothetical protein